ncbi:hypothetical protein FRACYDRAFT_269500 [Fragilariopsis cylindrus CCMP1102]|uniref:Uncharacterized protein n=1 Tax=Fragilariopsis cylindrus CCMP1102 TaxID=635003 RepID=A0A1E7FCF7_9STRA|nr:hypothetical protein FRACYDRAFT_269500 [Fragilariopsis cylindrus CCMP1102]|eukprot:OEU15814.1 hypothetical protein FRACYDRAFT_269500 [Fragilariopsis cylindrus CCMP1102]
MGTPNNSNKEDYVANVTNTTSSSTNSTPDGSATTPTRRISSSTTIEEKDNTFAMFIMALGVASAGGLAMKGGQTDSLLRRFSSASKIQQAGRGKAAATTRSTVPTKTKLKSKLDAYDKNKLYKVKKTMHEKDDFV